jgi:hypothetical protein
LEQIKADTTMLSADDSGESEVEDTPDDSPHPPEASADHHAFIFGYRSADVDLRVLHPLPSQIPFMWQVYQENVEPLIKILHVPTTDKIVRDIRKNIDGISPAHEALLFSIYYAAITSMEDDEVCHFPTAVCYSREAETHVSTGAAELRLAQDKTPLTVQVRL